jgi:hypothetical protein
MWNFVKYGWKPSCFPKTFQAILVYVEHIENILPLPKKNIATMLE